MAEEREWGARRGWEGAEEGVEDEDVWPRDGGEEGERVLVTAEAAAREEEGRDDGSVAEEGGVAEDAVAEGREGRGGGAGVDRVQRARDGGGRWRGGRAERRREACGHHGVRACRRSLGDRRCGGVLNGRTSKDYWMKNSTAQLIMIV